MKVTQQQEEAGKKKQKKEKVEIPRKKKRRLTGVSKSPESPFLETVKLLFADPELCQSRSLAPRVRSDACVWPQELLDVELTD